ncbi:MAG: fatty acid hydroxylase [Chitinophagaceae bacterium]|nr:MAG: fatty acid hydroxylase [Chitinophagaceae bacterium]
MKFAKIHNKGQARLFNNPVLEFFTRSHPLLIWGMYIPVIIYLVYYSYNSLEISPFALGFSFVTGMLSWTLFEYIMHRFIFHFMAEDARAAKIIYLIHGNHHEYPRDKERLFMPPLPSLILASAIFSVLYLLGYIVNAERFVFSFFGGFVFGYLLYGSMHYAIHAFKPPFKWMKPLWRNHHLHHYKSDDYGFGVSTTLWDRVFGTMFRPDEASTETNAAKD